MTAAIAYTTPQALACVVVFVSALLGVIVAAGLWR